MKLNDKLLGNDRYKPISHMMVQPVLKKTTDYLPLGRNNKMPKHSDLDLTPRWKVFF